MSKRVYEIARELDLNTKEVIEQLNDAGIEVRSHFAVVEEPIYERVFGDDPDGGSDGAAPSDHSAQEAEALWSRVYFGSDLGVRAGGGRRRDGRSDNADNLLRLPPSPERFQAYPRAPVIAVGPVLGSHGARRSCERL